MLDQYFFCRLFKTQMYEPWPVRGQNNVHATAEQ